MGAYLIGLWGLPDRIVEAVAFHSRPAECESTSFDALGVVHVASALATRPDITDPADPDAGVDVEYLTRLEVVDQWPAWQAACAEMPGEEDDE